jgi:hypothetical protein
MAIQVTNLNDGSTIPMLDGSFRRFGTLNVTGLTPGANNVPHGLPFAPTRICLRPIGVYGWSETAMPSATTIFVQVAAGATANGYIDYME